MNPHDEAEIRAINTLHREIEEKKKEVSKRLGFIRDRERATGNQNALMFVVDGEIFGIANSTSFAPLDLSGRLVRAESRRQTHSFSIDSEQGRVMVLDITTGSEFLRIITMPNGTTIVASGWVNQWDEEQVRELAMDQHRPQ
jgi:nitrite reductase/ring-hydroxylating ferredoxin subunit